MRYRPTSTGNNSDYIFILPIIFIILSKDYISRAIAGAGAIAVGFARACPLPDSENSRLAAWIDAGNAAGMDWMNRHALLRRNPDSVLPHATTVISAAFSYAPPAANDTPLPYLARYARSLDYHDVIRGRLAKITGSFAEGDWRICIDSAPLSERFWAVQAGIGFIGDNGALIVPGAGPEVILAEILTTLEFEPDAPSAGECLHCGACRRACPTGALLPDSTIDCRRCISYLTIEHRGPWSDPAAQAAMDTPAGRNTLFGCDRCIAACPLINRNITTTLPLAPLPDPDNLPLTKSQFRKRFAHSPILRAGLDGILRNLRKDSSAQ